MKLVRLAGAVAAMLAVALTATACSSGSSTSSSSTSLQSITVGYNGDFNGASLVAVANEQGIWAKNGLKVSLKTFTTGPLQIQALNAGDLDFGYLGPGALWNAAAGKAKIVAINSIGLADRVIAQPGITTVAGLKGKKVGVPTGTSGDMILRLALAQAGMTIKDVQEVAMDPATIVTAFSAKQIDAAGLWYPLVDTIKQKIPNLNELAKDSDFSSSITFPTAFVTGPDMATKNPALLTKFLKAVREANDYRAAHVDDAVTAVSKLLNVPVASLKDESQYVQFLTSAQLDSDAADGTVDKWLTSMNQLFIQFGELKTNTDPNTYFLAKQYTAAK
jgi:NitT/TauT family transport system substrate-binding protein